MTIKTTCAALVLLSLCGSYANARAATSSDSDVPSVKVPYGDLDLSSAAGAGVMLARIQHAAKKVCGAPPSDGLQHLFDYQPCVKQAIDGAVARLDRPVVTALNGGAASKEPVAVASR